VSNNNITTPSSTGNPSADEIIRVVGTGTTIASFIVSQLAKYTTEVLASGVQNIIISIHQSKITIEYTIKYAERQAQTKYNIAIKEDVSEKISDAISRAETNPRLRPEIRSRLMQELAEDLEEVYLQLRQEFRRQRS
jgi:hypothetical protein